MRLERVVVGFPSADANRVLDCRDEDLAVTDLASLGGALDGGERLVDLGAWHDDFDFDLRQEADGVFGTAIDFRMPLLTAVAFDLGDRHALQAKIGQLTMEIDFLDRALNRVPGTSAKR